MGAAAYRRGSMIISEQISRDFPMRDSAFAAMDRINAMAKTPIAKSEFLRGKRKPLLDKYAIQYDAARNIWWMMDPENMHEGFSHSYRSLEDVIRSWNGLYLTGYDYEAHIWTAEVC